MGLNELRSKNANGKMDKFIKAVAKTSVGRTSNYKKEDYYYPDRDKAGNGSAIIRFIPGLESEDFPYYVERMEHGFKSKTGQWYIENCPHTLAWEEICPACDYGNDMKAGQEWQAIPKALQDKIRPFFSKKQYYCNVLVIKDPATPENEGKVFPFKFGKSILDIMMGMAHPVSDGLSDPKDPVDVFDIEEGANFKFVIRIKKKRTNYESSEFEDCSVCPEFNDEDQVPILPKVGEKAFKSAEDLQKRFNAVMGLSGKPLSSSAEDMMEKKEHKVDDEVPEREKEKTPNASVDNKEYFKSIMDEVDVK